MLDVSAQSSITDYLVIATGTSEPHRRALRIELERILDETHTHIVGVETTEESGWTVVDAFDVMVHLFTPDQREHYGLENLWKDAKDVPVAQFLPPPPVAEVVVKAKPKPRAKPKAKPAAKAKAKVKTKPKVKAKAKAKPKAKVKAKAPARAKKKPAAKRRA